MTVDLDGKAGVSQFARLEGISTARVYVQIAEGLPHERILGRILIPVKAAQAWRDRKGRRAARPAATA